VNRDAHGEGFRALRREPALLALELLWRWSVGLGLLAMLFYAYAHLREAVLLVAAGTPALHSRDPRAVISAAVELVASLEPLLWRTLARIVAVAAVLWIVASTLGRGIITRTLARRFAAEYHAAVSADAPRWEAFAALKMGSVLMLLILVIGYLGGILVATLVDAAGHSLLISILILVASVAVAAIVWGYVNWVLSLAPIFVARDGLEGLEAVVAALGFAGRPHARLVAIAVWNATLRGLSATVITLAGIATVALRSWLPGWMVMVLLVVESVLYLLVSDYLLLARYAAYIAVAVHERSHDGAPGGAQPPPQASPDIIRPT
jgi:hypothetical protein